MSTLSLLTALSLTPARAQTRVTLSGTVRDTKTAEILSGATLRVVELPGVGTSADAQGHFTLTVPAGQYTLEASFLGYQTSRRPVPATSSQLLDLRLAADGQQLREVVVTARRQEATISRAQAGVETLDTRQIAKVPVLFGEKDVIKTLTLLPGVKPAGEGSSGFSVRGGNVDQNLVLLDEAPIYNASHLLGFFSTFNSDAVRDLTIYKGGMPAQYGGRLSSVVDVQLKDGNAQQLHGSGGIGLIASRLALEGPLVRDQGSFIVTGRRTYADVFLKASPNEDLRDARLNFYDFTAKANYRLGERTRLYFSGYLGHDVMGTSGFGFSYGNTTGTLRLQHQLSGKLASNTALIYSKYNYQIELNSETVAFAIASRIQDWNLKQDFEWDPAAGQKLRFGANLIYHTITPGRVEADADAAINATADKTSYALEPAVYASHEWAATPRLDLTTGLRFSGFSLLGPGQYARFDAAGRPLTTRNYGAGEVVRTYLNLEPRLAASYQLTPSSTVKAGYARNVQNLHLLSNSLASSPTDRYIPTSPTVKPELADQVSAGYFRSLGSSRAYTLSAEVYYKSLRHQIDYRDGAALNPTGDVEGDLLSGRGRTYGLELLVRKETGRLTGWVAYTLSKSERQFAQINRGAWFNARQDRPHDVSVVGVYQLTPQWSISGTFVTSSGSPVTYPVGKYETMGQVVSLYGPRNAERLPVYRRLDLGATFEKQRPPGQRFHSSWNFSLYNALGRENPYSINFQTVEDDPTRTEAVQTALFRWIPSATYNFNF
ncbi:TonB-dependent receptor [Hymenobacter wooponensis]|uniref:TonB-dependent receptor n=1 Tax=Hymenobacter wooponensis TaxID=1525360 RepID=A0A4Z0ME06_9BACT|nr:TonB-dependent receptor [Hymenobacter wooponensis]